MAVAAEERGSLSIEDDVVIKSNKKENRTWLHCHPLYVLVAVLFVLFILALVGVLTYILPKRQCATKEIRPTFKPSLLTESAVTRYPATGESTFLYPSTETSEWSSDGPAAGMGGPWEGRLPRSVIPLRYNLTITPYFYPEDLVNDRERFTFDGRVSITTLCRESTNRVIIHVSSMNISELSVYNSQTEEGNLVSGYEEDYFLNFLKIDLITDLTVDAVYIIDIEYVGIIQEDPLGFYKTSYKDDNGERRWGGVTTMQPTSARKATPCFDEPELKAEFDVTIRHRSDMTALSNGIERSITELEGNMTGWKETVFKTTPKMSSYLLAFAVTHFVSLNRTTESGVLIRVWSKPQDINYTQYALESAVKQTTFFESYFDYDYPLEKQDMLTVPNFIALAMENWGLIVYQEMAMLYNPDLHSLYRKEQVAMIVSHEIAHQWFGNLVTPAWWDDLWLNEGFARYTEYLGVDYSEPEWKIRKEMFLDNNFKTAMRQDSSSESHPVREKVNTPDEIFSIFDHITYNKGATVIRMLINMLSEDVFIAGLREYLKVHAYDNTNTEDLWESLTKADVDHGGNDVKVIMDTWTLQPFFPLVTFNRTSDTSIVVSQNIFLSDDEARERYEQIRPTYGNFTWEILISHTHESENNFKTPTKEWLHSQNTGTITLTAGAQPSDWYLTNIGCYGYYRINYDATNWNNLIRQLIEDHKVFPVQNRFQVLDDALVLFETERLDIETLLNLTLYLHEEADYLPWTAATAISIALRNVLKMQPTYGLLQKYWLQKLSPMYRRLGWESDMQEYPLNLKHRFQVIEAACFLRDEHCLRRAKELYAEYMANPEHNPVPSTTLMRRFQYCYGIMQGGQQEWEFGLEQFLALSPDARHEDSHWLYGLSCTRQPWLLNRLLNDAYYGKLDKYRAFNIVAQHMAAHDVGLPVVWNYVQLHWERMWNDYDNDVRFSFLLHHIGEHMYSEVHLQQLIDFGKTHDLIRGSSVEKQYMWVINRLKTIIKTRADYSGETAQWLTQHL